MRATIEVPDELYRQVKAKSALEGRAVREVAEELFRNYLSREPEPRRRGRREDGTPTTLEGEPLPPWFGALGKYARRAMPFNTTTAHPRKTRSTPCEPS